MRKTLIASALLLQAAVAHAALPAVEVWKSPTCGCCTEWVNHMRQAGFEVTVHLSANLPAARAQTGMPDRYGACHSAMVGGYAVEGHVPAADVKTLLAQRPQAIGIAVPGMPPGSPGMAGQGQTPYRTLLVKSANEYSVLANH